MSISALIDGTATDATTPAGYSRWQTVLFWVMVLVLFVVAIGMRLYDLGLPFDRDGYDEGVYWQSLLAMRAGTALYQQIFYSQPPFFLLSVFPSFVVFGSTLWSARLGIALLSLFGLLGAFLLGKVLSGRLGALLALLLLVVNPLYLVESQTLQAEAPSIAFALLAVALAYLWWEHPGGKIGLCWAALTGIALGLSILSKLLGVAAVVPIALLMLARLWQIWQRRVHLTPIRGVTTFLAARNVKSPGGHQDTSQNLFPIFVGIAACVATMLIVLLPFSGSYQSMLQEVITFHIQTGAVFTRAGNKSQILHVLISVLGVTAFYGTCAALLRRDWRVLPLLAWLLGTAFILWRQDPLFTHHLVALSPAMIALAVMGVGSQTPQGAIMHVDETLPTSVGADLSCPPPIYRPPGHPILPDSFVHLHHRAFTKWATPLAVLLILVTVVFAIQQDGGYYRTAAKSGVDGLVQQEAGIAADLRHAITADQLVVTDGQFIAALAGRRTPALLVDTSLVRINGGDLTVQQLIDATSQPQVHAVLFFSGRFYLAKVAGFHAWVAQHFHLLRTYKPRLELWVR